MPSGYRVSGIVKTFKKWIVRNIVDIINANELYTEKL